MFHSPRIARRFLGAIANSRDRSFPSSLDRECYPRHSTSQHLCPKLMYSADASGRTTAVFLQRGSRLQACRQCVPPVARKRRRPETGDLFNKVGVPRTVCKASTTNTASTSIAIPLARSCWFSRIPAKTTHNKQWSLSAFWLLSSSCRACDVHGLPLILEQRTHARITWTGDHASPSYYVVACNYYGIYIYRWMHGWMDR